MSITLTTPVTGSTQTGFSSPTYTIVADSSDGDTKRYVVTGLGGTQAGVTTHATSSPFSINFWRPRNTKNLEAPGTDGVIRKFPRNRYGITVRKGMDVAAGQLTQIAKCEMAIDLPVGAEVYDAAEIRAMLSLAVGALSQVSSGLGDTLVNNVL